MTRQPGYYPGRRLSIGLAVASINSAVVIGAGVPDGPKLHQVALIILASLLTPLALVLVQPPIQKSPEVVPEKD